MIIVDDHVITLMMVVGKETLSPIALKHAFGGHPTDGLCFIKRGQRRHQRNISMLHITMTMVLLAGVWEAEVREEKEEEADEEDETKQAAHNQLCFRFHLSVLILT